MVGSSSAVEPVRTESTFPPKTDGPVVRAATADDAAGIWHLVRESGALDVNSPYAYLLACRHYGETCLVAEDGEILAGFVVAYRPPRQDDTVFVWQVGVAHSHRKQGLGRRLLHELVRVGAAIGVRYVEATVTPSNTASQRLFRGLAADLGVACDESLYFPATSFPDGEAHEEEWLFRIGPFDAGTPNDQHDPTRQESRSG